MKKLIATVSFLATIGTVSAAIWNCDLEARLNGTQMGFLLNHTKLGGQGTLTCTNDLDDSIYKRSISARISNWSGGIGYSKYRNSTLKARDIFVSAIGDLFDEFDLFIWGEATFFKHTVRTSIMAENDYFEFPLVLSTKNSQGFSLSGLHFGTLTIEEVVTPASF